MVASTDEPSGLRAALIDAALALLEAGAREPSLRAVARAAGVSAMAPYRHFSDKAALLGAVADHGFARLRAALEVADATADGRAALLAQGLTFVNFARSHPALFRLMYSPHHGCAASPAGEAAHRILRDRVATLVPAQATAAALACRALVQGLASLEGEGRLETPEAVPEALRLFVYGLGADVRP